MQDCQTIEDHSQPTMQDLKEFDEHDLKQLAEAGITPHHLARFLDSLRNNVDPCSPPGQLVLFDESEVQGESCCAFG